MGKDFQKDVTMEFLIDGVSAGSGVLMVRNGVLNSEDAEEEFNKTIRKQSLHLVQEAAEEEQSNIVDALKPEDEEKLKAVHAKDYHGTDDDMSDAYEDWLTDLSLEELKEIL